MTPLFFEVTDERGLSIWIGGELVMTGDNLTDIISFERALTLEMRADFGPDYPPLQDHATIFRLKADLSAWIARRLG